MLLKYNKAHDKSEVFKVTHVISPLKPVGKVIVF